MRQQSRIFIHLLIALLAAAVLFICFKPLIEIADLSLIADSVVSGIILSGIIILLTNGLKYGNFQTLVFFHRTILYAAMSMIFVAGWLGLSYAISYTILPTQDAAKLANTIPIRALVGILVYIAVMFATTSVAKTDKHNAELGLDNEEPESIHETASEEKEEKKEDDEVINSLEHVAVKNGQKIDVILVTDIVHLQAEGDYVMIHSTKGKFLKEQTMKYFDSALPKNKFVRVHRSSIINIDYIAQIELYDKQSQLLKLKNGAQVKISLTGYKLLKKELGL